MTTLHLDRTTAYPSCSVHGYIHRTQQLNSICQTRFNLHINNFTIHDAREYDEFADARDALLDMYHNNLYEEAIPEPIYTLINTKTGERVSGTVQELTHKFGYKSTQSIYNFINKSGKTPTRLKNRIVQK